MSDTRSSQLQSAGPYLAAVLLIAAATLLVSNSHILIERGALPINLAVVALVTWFGGWRPGILAIALTTMALAWFVFTPRYSFVIDKPEDWLRLGIYLFVAGLIATLHASREGLRDKAWEKEQRLKFTLESTNFGAWYFDLKTGRFWWSEEMEKLFGKAPGEFTGTYESFVGYIHPDDQESMKRAITHAVEGGTALEIEHRIVLPDGTIRCLLTRGKMIPDDAGKTILLLGVAMDITERGNQNKAMSLKVAPMSAVIVMRV